ncbi:MAG: hypothetical protein V3V15_09955 [Sphingorhabdus sp.]
MFIGHFAPALVAAAHPKAPKLGTLFVAAQLVDFAFFGLALIGVEKMRIVSGMTAMNGMDLYYMPYTHSLLGGGVWALVFGALIYAFSRSRTGALIGAAVVISHWFADLIVHAPDLTLAGSPPKLGFALWNYPLIEMPLELGITGAALGYYAVKTRSADGGNMRVWILGGALLLVQIYNWLAPEPEAFTAALPISALLAFAVFAGLAAWAGSARRSAVIDK